MDIILELLFDIFTLNMTRKVKEEDICENMAILKEIEWFQVYLQDNEYRTLIIHDEDVRNVIGRFRSNKLEKDPNHFPYQKKMYDIIQKKSGVGAN